jgi:serine/threonine-protein kinase
VRTLGRRYRLEKELGTGGMAVVWRAQDLVLGRQVAVKLLGPSFSGRQSRERIRAEARVAARLAHPNVAGVYDFGESRHGRRGKVPYIVMELVHGETLAVRQQSDTMHWRTAVGIAAEVAAALAAAHASGVVHRDVKPGNIMLARTGVKVVDFGIAAAVGELDDHGDELLGTPAYVAPERFVGRPAAPATDVYALGVLLYQCLTGTLPWPACTANDLVTAHRELPPAPLPPIPGLPDDVAELCEQCLSKDPDERPSSLYAAVVLGEAAGVAVTLPAVGSLEAAPLLEPASRPAHAATSRPAHAATSRPAHAATSRPAHAATPAVADAGDATRPVRPRLPRRHRLVNGYLSERISIGRFSVRRVIASAGLAVVVGLATLGAAVAGARVARDRAEGPSGAAATPSGGCAARYVANPANGGTFTAEMAITNTGRARLDTWSLAFALPVGQRITDAGGLRFDQQGEDVTLHGDRPLEAGGTRQLALTGTASAGPVPPTRFTLDGAPCTPAAGGTAVVPPATR